MRDIEQIISELEQQKTAIESAISALRGIASQGTRGAAKTDASARKTVRKRRLSAEGRERIAAAARQRWAAQKAAAAGESASARKQVGRKGRRKRASSKSAAAAA